MRYKHGQAISGKPEEFTLDVPERWAICFALDAHIWLKVDEWFRDARGFYTFIKPDLDDFGFKIMVEGRRKNLEDLAALYYRLSAWDETDSTSDYGEENPIWLASWDDRISELLQYPPEWYD